MKERKFKKGDTITFTIVKVYNDFGLMIVKSELGDVYTMDTQGGPMAYRDEPDTTDA